MITTEFEGTVVVMGATPCKIPVQVHLAYDEEYDPYAVQMIFSDGEDEVVWVVARDLLLVGVNSYRKVGSGDIAFRYEGPRDGGTDGFLVCLKSHEGHSDLRLPHSRVVAWLNETTATVKPGTECVTDLLDEAIEEILSS